MTALPAISEADFQAQVIELAHWLGWEHMHVRRSIGKGRKWTTATNVVGWPDLTLWHHRHGFVFAELKAENGRATAEQVAVLGSLQAAGAVAVVWRPSDLDGSVLRILRGDNEGEQ